MCLSLIPSVMGAPVLSENLDALITAMGDFPANSGLKVILSWAKMIGCCLALGVGGNECFQMILGRRGMDVMKILHILIISICITNSSLICNMAHAPGRALQHHAKSMCEKENAIVAEKEEAVAALQEKYIDKVRDQLRKLEENQESQRAAESDGIIDDLLNSIEDIKLQIQNRLKEFALLAETKICEWISIIIRYIGEVIFQVSFYGLLVSANIFMHILACFAPLMFALSLSPHYKTAWSQWLSKYVSLSLWGFVCYLCIYYIDFILQYNLEQDITSYTTLINNVHADVDGDTQIIAIGMQSIGSTCMYVVGLLIGVRVISFVPEVASWLMPGGVSSGIGSSMGGQAVAGAAAGAGAGVASRAAGVAGNIGSQAGRNLHWGENYGGPVR